MPLTIQQLREFHTDGYLILRQAIPVNLIDEARRAVNHSLGSDGLPPDLLKTYSAQSYCPGIRDTAVITDLFNRTPLYESVEQMVGAGNLLPAKGGQIALRFPGFGAQHERRLNGHLDGIGSDTNGIPKGQFVRNFTALVTVYLADTLEPWHGNFTVWPGSHAVAEAFFKSATPDELRKGMPTLQLTREPVQVCGRAGDVCISHHQLVHTAAPNHGPNIRYAAIFRAAHMDAQAFGPAAMTDIWREWPGVRAALTAPS